MTAFRRMALIVLCLTAAVPLGLLGRGAVAADALTPEQRQAVQELMRSYLLENPEVILQSVRQHQEKQQLAAQQRQEQALVSNRAELERDNNTPFTGNPNGDITIVEFFDYNCGYCKKMIPTVQDLLATDKNIRFVFKDLPVIRPESLIAAKAATAVWKVAPDKHFAYHVALLNARGDLNEAFLYKTAESLGVDLAKMKQVMADPETEKALKRNIELSHLLGISGTPAYIIGQQMYPGAVELDQLREMVAKQRAG